MVVYCSFGFLILFSEYIRGFAHLGNTDFMIYHGSIVEWDIKRVTAY
jgi:hypothetical protein